MHVPACGTHHKPLQGNHGSHSLGAAAAGDSGTCRPARARPLPLTNTHTLGACPLPARLPHDCSSRNGQVRGESRPLKKRIEGKFDEIKSVTEKSKTPELSPEHKEWLQTLTWDVRCLLVSMPPGLQDRLGPVAELLAATLR